METQGRSALVYMDRLSGELFSSKELTVVRRDAVDFKPEEALEANLYRANLHGPELINRLPLGDDDTFDRLRHTRVVRSDLFAVVDIEPDKISGLPTRTPASVGLAIRASLEIAISKGSLSAEIMPSPEAALGSALVNRRESVPLDFGPDTFIVGGPNHLSAAEKVIRQARRIVIIHSTFVGTNIKQLMPALRDAAGSGVQIYIHWGKQDDPELLQSNPSEIAARMALREIPDLFRANVHLGNESTTSHAKIILADTGSEGDDYCALIGSCNWLDSPFRSVEASVKINTPAAIAEIASRLASILVPTVGQNLVVDRLIDIHAECSANPSPPKNHSIMIVVDDNHYTAVRDAMNEVGPNGSVILGSHKFGHAGETTVIDPMRAAARSGAKVKLYFTRVLPNFGNDAAAQQQEELAKSSVDLLRSGEEMHAKFIGWNDKLLVTSFNFLSASLNGRHRGGSEIGALICGPGVSEDFESKLRAHGVLSEYHPAEGVRPKRKRRRRHRRTVEVQV